jgi:hypothetical protein
MNTKHVPRRCASCKQLFFPDARTRHRQTFCGKVECQETRMAENRRSWLEKPENAHYGRDNPKAKHKTREWRKKHPGYSFRVIAVPGEFLSPGPGCARFDWSGCRTR